MSLIIDRQVWNAQAVTATKTLNSIVGEFAAVLSVLITIEPSGFSGTLDFQGKDEGGTFTNVFYAEVDRDGGVKGATNDQISLTTSSARQRFLLPLVPSNVQIVMTRTAGSVSLWARGTAMPLQLPSSRELVSKGDQQITALSSATNLTVPAGARRAVIQVLTQGVYFTEDSVTPSSTNGSEADPGDVLNYLDADYSVLLPNLEFIEKAASAKLNVLYYD